jgi:hypothetical protein
MSGGAFYSVADARYFLGAVGLLNSLRLQGHREPVFLLDCGLTPRQRDLLEPHVTLVPAPDAGPPWLRKTVAPLQRPADVMVLIDADVVVTRPLTDLSAKHAEHVIGFRNEYDRFIPEWGELLGLGEIGRRPYLSTGLVVLRGSRGERLLEEMSELQERVDFGRTHWGANEPTYPFLYADQDVFNALVAARLEARGVVALRNRLLANPPFRGLRVIDRQAARCAYTDGTEPYAVHHHTAKPWLEATHDGVYSQLLRRLLSGPDIAVRVPTSEVPLRMRQGLIPFVERQRINLRERLRMRASEK